MVVGCTICIHCGVFLVVVVVAVWIVISDGGGECNVSLLFDFARVVEVTLFS